MGCSSKSELNPKKKQNSSPLAKNLFKTHLFNQLGFYTWIHTLIWVVFFDWNFWSFFQLGHKFHSPVFHQRSEMIQSLLCFHHFELGLKRKWHWPPPLCLPRLSPVFPVSFIPLPRWWCVTQLFSHWSDEGFFWWARRVAVRKLVNPLISVGQIYWTEPSQVSSDWVLSLLNFRVQLRQFEIILVVVGKKRNTSHNKRN